MIVKMKFINISGPRDDIDRVIDLYLSKYEIQLESALSELKTVDNLRPFMEINPYREALGQAEQFTALLEDPDQITPDTKLGLDGMFELIRNTSTDYQSLQEKKEKLKKKIEELHNRQLVIAPFRPLDCNLSEVLNYKYITYRFGKIAVEYYYKMQKYLMEDLESIFVEGERDESYVYGAYFVSPRDAQKSDAIFRSLHFERIRIPMEYIGTPEEACTNLQNDIKETKAKIDEVKAEIKKLVAGHASQLLGTQKRLQELSNNFDVRRSAARISGDEQEDNYILCGWMSEENVEKLLKETKDDNRVFIMVEEDREKFFGDPPTELKNPKLFKPFEMFIRMYGLPSHNEMDPTVFVALTYTFIFGAMFGDVGQEIGRASCRERV